MADSFDSALDQPYFGRLDFYRRDRRSGETNPEDAPDEASLRTTYLGIVSIPAKNISNWTAPVGRLWYTKSRDSGYTAPRGYIATHVELKRYLRIRDGSLEDINDIFSRRLAAPDDYTDPLAKALAETGDEQLQVIVATIEPNQYENIANISDRVLIVQGAAGSGKSEIGLHRIAFLLSPFSDAAQRDRPTPQTTLFVGPSQTFLDYADDILPQLGVGAGVRRVRFSEWQAENLSESVRSTPMIWNSLLANGEVKLSEFDETAETFKGSLHMADILQRHVRRLEGDIHRRCRDLPPVMGPDRSVRVTKERVAAEVEAVFASDGAALDRRRASFVERISAIALQAGLPRRRQLSLDEMDQRRNLIAPVIESWCNAQWRRIDFREEYIALLSDPELMLDLAPKRGSARLTPPTAAALAESALGMSGNQFGDSDMGALAYLDHLLNGSVERRYRHIVIDEAQDISPIEFELLAASSANNWFTVLGDTAQRLTPYRGVRRWPDLYRVFGRNEIAVNIARETYRSTKEITTFSNRLLRTFDKNISAPIAYERSGPRVEYSRHERAADMYRAILEDIPRIRSLRGLDDDAIVAVLAKDTRNINRFSAHCEEAGFDEIALASQDRRDSARSVLARIPDAKGLEYDAVIVMGVNDSFSDTLFNKKLLYLAATRAKHYLAIHWHGRRSPILDAITDRGVEWQRK